MNAEAVKTWVDIWKGLAELLGIAFAAAAAYGVLLLSSKPRLRVEILVHWPAGTLGNSSILSAQLRLINPAAGSQVVTEAEVDRLVFEQNGNCCSLSPYALLKPMALGEKQEFEAKVQEFVRPTIIIGCGQDVQHIAFIPDKGNEFVLIEGQLTVRLRVRYTVHNPLLRVFQQPRFQVLEVVGSRQVNKNDAARCTEDKWGWLERDLQFERARG